MVGISADTWNTVNDYTHNEGEESTLTGSADGILGKWLADRNTLLRDMIASGDISNNSQFDIPAGIVDDGWSRSFEEADEFHGSSISGTMLDNDGTLLSGTVTILQNDTAIAQDTSVGKFNINGAPPETVISGDGSGPVNTTGIFQPSVAGVPYVVEDMTLRTEIGQIQYGKVSGTVVDNDGNPVQNDAVAGLGNFGTTTDQNGNFEVLAPGETDITLFALKGTAEITEYINAGSASEITIRYPKLSVKVLDLDYEPVEGARVEIQGALYETDESGLVEIPTAPLGEYEITVNNYFTATYDVAEPGQEYTIQLSDDNTNQWDQDGGIGGIRANVVDSVTGRRIQQIRAVDLESQSISNSGKTGTLKLLKSDETPEVNLLIGDGDMRYVTEKIKAQLPSDRMAEAKIELDPRTVVSNT